MHPHLAVDQDRARDRAGALRADDEHLGADDVELRRHFIQTNAKDVRFLDI